MPIKVILVDDHKMVLQGIRAYLHTLAGIILIACAITIPIAWAKFDLPKGERNMNKELCGILTGKKD